MLAVVNDNNGYISDANGIASYWHGDNAMASPMALCFIASIENMGMAMWDIYVN